MKEKYLLCLNIFMGVYAAEQPSFNGNEKQLLHILNIATLFPVNADIFLNDQVQQGVDFKAAGNAGSTVLHAAVRKNCPIFIAYCANAGANMNVQDAQGRTPLHIACDYQPSSCTQKIVELLIQNNAKANISDNYQQTPLHTIIQCKTSLNVTKEIVDLLMLAGLNIQFKDKWGKTAWDYASEDVKKILLREPYHPYKQLDLQNPPIYGLRHWYELLKQAIPLGLNINAYDSVQGRSLLSLFFDSIDYAQLGLMEEIIDLFIQYKINVNHKNKHGDTVLHKIITLENFPETWMKKLIDAGGNVDVQNNDGESPLHWAACKWCLNNLIINIPMAQLLITYGKANINAQNKRGMSPLHYAMFIPNESKYKEKQKQIINLFLFYGADVQLLDDQGRTAYTIACNQRYDDVASMLKNNDSVYEEISELF